MISWKDKLITFTGILVMWAVVEYADASDTMDTCVPAINYDQEYVQKIQKHIKELYIIYVTEQKRIAEDMYMKGEQHEW
tara:strand:+ start:120 stop:356 length:237 start_codon:yes stop_codon:yes gene_type:complete